MKRRLNRIRRDMNHQINGLTLAPTSSDKATTTRTLSENLSFGQTQVSKTRNMVLVLVFETIRELVAEPDGDPEGGCWLQ